jgi:hypothetical protein
VWWAPSCWVFSIGNSSWIAVLNIRPQVWNYNPGTFPTYIRKFFMDSYPQYPPPGTKLNQGTFPILLGNSSWIGVLNIRLQVWNYIKELSLFYKEILPG